MAGVTYDTGALLDLAVVEGAIRRGDAVVTSDDGHVQRIADAVPAQLRIARV
jgi:hypothetical protein